MHATATSTSTSTSTHTHTHTHSCSYTHTLMLIYTCTCIHTHCSSMTQVLDLSARLWGLVSLYNLQHVQKRFLDELKVMVACCMCFHRVFVVCVCGVYVVYLHLLTTIPTSPQQNPPPHNTIPLSHNPLQHPPKSRQSPPNHQVCLKKRDNTIPLNPFQTGSPKKSRQHQ